MKRLAQIAGIILCLTILYGVVRAQTPSGAYNSPAQGGTSSGTVTSVSGTANQISVATGTTTPVISVPSTFIAPGSIAATTTLGAGANGGTAGGMILQGSTSGSETCTNSSNGGTITCNGVWAANSFNVTATYLLNGKTFAAANVPTISSGFGTSPSIVTNNGTTSYRVNVGTGGSASSGVIGMANATNTWNCHVYNLTAHAGNRADDTFVTSASATNSITVQNQTVATGAAIAWTASDILVVNCGAN